MAQQLRHPDGVGKKTLQEPQPTAKNLPYPHYKPRGSPAHAAPRPIVHHEFAAAYRRRLAHNAAKVPVLPAHKRKVAPGTQ